MRGGNNNIFGGALGIVELKLLKDYDMIDNKKDLKLNLIHPDFQSKDGFILYYNPSCPHCVNFSNVYKEVAERLKGAIGMGVVNCADAINGNDLLSDYFKIVSVPTLQFRNSVTGEYIDYTGGRTVVDMLSFICRVSNICKK